MSLTLRLEDFILPFEVVYVLLVGSVLSPHELNVICCLLQDLGPTGLKPRTILQFSVRTDPKT